MQLLGFLLIFVAFFFSYITMGTVVLQNMFHQFYPDPRSLITVTYLFEIVLHIVISITAMLFDEFCESAAYDLVYSNFEESPQSVLGSTQHDTNVRSKNIVNPVIKKIPGEIPPAPKKSSQGYIDDLSKKQKFELLDLLDRQNKLLANKRFIAKLPDKGEKILSFKEKIEHELVHRNKIEDAANLLSRLNIASEGKAAMSELEWTGKYVEKSKDETVVELDSDDESDPLKILAQPTGTGVHNKKIIHVVPTDSLIKPEDIAEAESFKTIDPLELEHVKYITSMVENTENEKKREPFKPYKTTRSNVHDPEKEKQRESKKDKYWEVTAATPPLIVHGAVKTLDINESLRLQQEHEAKLKEVQVKHAAERLAHQLGLHSIGGLPSNIGNHRGQNMKDSDSSSEDEKDHEEVYDDEDNDKAGTVVFTVDTEES